MELRWLESFVVVAEELHFAQAANRLRLAPSALNAQIKALESNLGMQLIEHGTRARARPALTAAGAAFLPEAERTLAKAARAVEVGRRAARGELGRVEIGYVASAAFSGVLTRTLAQCAAPGSELTVAVRELETPAQLKALAAGNIDIGLLRWRPRYPPGIEATCLLSEDVLVAVSDASPLATCDAIAPEQLRDECFVAPHFDEEHDFRHHIIEVGEHGGFDPRIAPPVRDFIAALTLVGGGLATALVPASLRRAKVPGVALRPLAELELTTHLVSACREHDPSPAVRSVITRLRRALDS